MGARQKSRYHHITRHARTHIFHFIHVGGWQQIFRNKSPVPMNRDGGGRPQLSPLSGGGWGRLGGPWTHQRAGLASLLVQRRSASAGLYYPELFRATSNYVYFSRRGSSERRSTARAPSDLQARRLALFLGQSEIRFPRSGSTQHGSLLPNFGHAVFGMAHKTVILDMSNNSFDKSWHLSLKVLTAPFLWYNETRLRKLIKLN